MEAAGTLEELRAGRSALRPEALKATPVFAPQAVAPAPAFDLREELEKLKKDGLIREVEFQELCRKVMDKARVQVGRRTCCGGLRRGYH